MKKAGKLLPWALVAAWAAVLADCVIVDAREAVWLACGMLASVLPTVLLRKKLRRVAAVLTAGLHLYVIGMIVFLMAFAGAHTATGGETGPMFLLGSDLKDGRPGALFMTRIDKAVERLEADPEKTVIVCGGLTGENTVTEAQAALSALTERGIAPERILSEDRSTRTLDNFDFAAALLEDGSWDRHQPTAVITNRFHFYRTARLAETAGYDDLRLIPADGPLPAELPWTVREVLTVTKFLICGPN